MHLDNVLAFDNAAKRLKAPAELQALLANVGGKPVVSYCNTGHQAAITWFALSEILRQPATLYDGSMSEWTEASGATGGDRTGIMVPEGRLTGQAGQS